uniref:Phospholipase A1 PLIP2, chloroplastic isoform X2 n=1 Tax=Elaeis guineensis var. tenera TaxID=51953 RepID=A0A6J0PR00_ELAGV|nr:phospholipase A1 PLIP2, chloroplastic isoform X2 [Elaeis guineensis]
MAGLRLIRGIAPPGVAVGVDVRGHHSQPSAKVSTVAPRDPGGGIAVETAAVPSRQLRRLWPGGGGGALEAGSVEEVVAEEKTGGGEEAAAAAAVVERRRWNWVLNILRVRSLSAEEGGRKEEGWRRGRKWRPAVIRRWRRWRREICALGADGGDGSEGCVVGEGDEEPVVFDRESFSRFLRRLSVAEVKLYAKLSYLGNLAYIIPKIKPKNLLKYHGLRFVTSSLEKKGKSSSSDKIHMPSQDQGPKEVTGEGEENGKQQENGSPISASTAYKIAASAVSYLQLRTKGILPFGSTKAERAKDSTEEGREDEVEGGLVSSEETSFLATTNSVTAMVAGKEEMKQAVAKNLNSSHSSPCEWFICDDDSSSTRYFVIQGSESLASWQANLLFEPIQFEKMLYAPMGKLLILQPEEKFSPHHHLLPPGSGLYLLGDSLLDSDDSARLLQAAQSAFINIPHPLEILSHRSAYGPQGTVYRDHNMNSYLRSFRAVIHQELQLIRKAKREQRRQVWWPLVAAHGLHASIITGQHAGSSTSTEHRFSFAGVLHVGKETVKQFGRLFASQHVQVLVVLLLPARLLLLRTFSIF